MRHGSSAGPYQKDDHQDEGEHHFVSDMAPTRSNRVCEGGRLALLELQTDVIEGHCQHRAQENEAGKQCEQYDEISECYGEKCDQVAAYDQDRAVA